MPASCPGAVDLRRLSGGHGACVIITRTYNWVLNSVIL